ncbi:VOC family protein [Paraglaciecola sp. 20A4]|uniref:VOC family protein n=1 Tax=Paraglaciecola sp. 20A4 TaxID=2687288 RepID=UPI00140D4980|nr:VOC family protein [Paraglaciecola sp. 20A4]
MKIRSSLFAVMLCALPCIQSIAAPVSDEERISVDIRRTTFLVNDIDTSLKLYRDALGLNVIYDQMINSPMENGETRKRRLVLLQANDTFIGALGLLQYIYPEKPQRQEKFDEPVPGDPIMVMNVSDLDTRWKSVEKSPKVAVIEAPHHVEYPRADGGKIAVMVSMIRDPDGYWLEVNQLLDAPAKASD